MITNILNPQILLLAIPVILVLIFLLFRNFVRIDIGDQQEKKRFRLVILATRTLILLLLIIALAKPFGEVTVASQGNPKITILVDNSSSMQVMDSGFVQSLVSELEKEVPVAVKNIGSGTESAIGDSILGLLDKDTNLLVISDGNNNQGTDLGDIALFAANLNSTISVVEMKTSQPEVGVYIEGPDSGVRGVNSTYTVRVVNLEKQEVKLRVVVDNEEIFNSVTGKESFSFQRNFVEGEHKITAEVSASKDHFKENNIFYKVVNVVKKPKILVISNTADPVDIIFNELYDVTKQSSIPADLDDYYAIIINDMPAGSLKGAEKLADYLVDKEGGYYGNGLFVIGGFDSFDRGDYKGSILESYLPVTVGKAARKRGSSNIAISIDFSGTTGERYDVIRDPVTGKIQELKKQASNVQDINKALAASVINSLGPDNTVGVSIFSSQSATVSELQPLFKIKKELIDKIAQIQQPAGQSYFHIGLSGAYALLKDHVGTNNIIMITDGQTGNENIRQQTLDAARTINARGVKVYIVGTGRNVDEKFLKDIAYNGGGIYFPASQENNLKILFGEPEDSKFGEVFDLFILNQYHFITQGLELDASLYGFNQVVPKNNALLLVTTQHGEPALTVWSYGLGRVASLNVFSGNNNLGDLLNKKNSILLTRITNWCIGDPQRKDPYYVIIEDTRINEKAEVIVKSDKYPSAEGLSLTRTGENQYKATLLTSKEGFNQVLGKSFSVNYEQEYQDLGMNPRLYEAVTMSGGRIFTSKESDEMIKFVKSASKRTRSEKTTIIWPFLLFAAIIFLIEVIIRKLREHNLNV